MIIIKTANGDRFINEAEVKAVSHNKEYCFVVITYKDGTTENAFQVERIYYTNKADTKIEDDGLLLSAVRSDAEYFKQLNKSAEYIVDKLTRERTELEYFILNFIGKPDDPYAQRRIKEIEEARQARLEYGGDELRHYRSEGNWYPMLRMESREKGEETDKEFARLTDKIKHLTEMGQRYDDANKRIMNRNLWQRIINKMTWL